LSGVRILAVRMTRSDAASELQWKWTDLESRVERTTVEGRLETI